MPDDDPFIVHDDTTETQFEFSEDRLEAARIQRIPAMRRATYRSRSHAIIAAAVCAVGLIQLLITAWQKGVGTIAGAAYLAFAIAAGAGAIFFIKRARELHCELRRSSHGR